jgi:hypothetical protein
MNPYYADRPTTNESEADRSCDKHVECRYCANNDTNSDTFRLQEKIRKTRSELLCVILVLICMINVTGYSQSKISCPSHLYYQYFDLLKGKDTSSAQATLTELFRKTDFGSVADIYNLYASNSIKSDSLNKILSEVAIKKGCDIDFFNELLKASNFDTIPIASSVYIENRKLYLSKLDSFIIHEILAMRERDQAIRKRDHNTQSYFRQMKYVDSTNILMLKSLVKFNDNMWPTMDQLGADGSSALRTILHHFDVEYLNEIFPTIVFSIQDGTFFDAETILYQIDRNMIGGDKIYLYDAPTKKFIMKTGNTMVHEKVGYYQYYGGMDVFDPASKKKYLWPLNPNRDMNIVNALLDDLCILPLVTDKDRNIRVSDTKFIDIVLKN